MKQAKWMVCPRCKETIGPYNEDVEKQRKKQGFSSWCTECKTGVKPIYI